MDDAFERRVIDLYESALDWPPGERMRRLAALTTDEPALLTQIEAMLNADSAMLPTQPPSPAASDDRCAVPPDRIGPYLVGAELGRGGMGVVYLATRADGLFEQSVAIKLIRNGLFSSGALAQFAMERRILARLHHPHIAQLLDGGVTEGGTSYIIMERIEGASITDHVAAHGTDLGGRIALFRQACDAIAHAHRNLVVHADIKPSNVVVADMFGVKLLDFGISRLLGQADDDAHRAHTPGYASSARLAGLPAVPADDIFALGALLHTLIDGAPGPGIDADLTAIADKAGAAESAGRYGTIAELVDDLDRWARHKPVTARLPSRMHRAQLFWRRRRLPIIAAGVLLTLLIGTAILTTALYLRANAARAAAEQRFEETRALSRYLIDDVTEALEPLPGSGPIQQHIAERANRALEQLSRVPGASFELKADSARAYTRVGDILANSDLRQSADPTAAPRALRHAVTTLRPLVRELPARRDLRLALARALVTSAHIVQADGNRPQEAIALLDEGDALLAPLLAAGPDRAQAAAVRWDGDLVRAAMFDMQGDFAAVARLIARIHARFVPLPLPHDADRALRIERGWSMLADAQYYGGDHAAALASYRTGLDGLRVPELADDARVVMREAYAAFNISSTLAEMHRWQDALDTIRIGVAAMARLRSFDSSPRVLHMQAIVLLEYATDLAGVGRHEESIAPARASLAQRIAQARLQPLSYEALRSVPVGMRPLAEIYRSAGHEALACRTLGETDAVWNAIARRMPLAKFDAETERAEVRRLRKPCR